MQDSNRSIIQSVKGFFTGTLLSRFSGLLRDVFMAYCFGTQEMVAAFLVAFRFAHVLRRLFGEGALHSAFIPQFETLRHKDPARAVLFFRDLSLLMAFFLSLVIILAMSVLSLLLHYDYFLNSSKEVVFLTSILMPSLLFICLYALNSALLQCEKKYFLSGVAPMVCNLVWIFGIYVLSDFSAKEAMPHLAKWVVFACCCQWLITLPFVISILKKQNIGISLCSFSDSFSDLKKFGYFLLIGIFGVAAAQINNAVDALFSRYADLQGPAYLWYALRIQQVPLALFGIAISGALLPPLTRALKQGAQEKYQRFMRIAMQKSIALIAPISFALIAMGPQVISLVYGRGDFSLRSIEETGRCLIAYSTGLIPQTLVLILAPAFYAQSNFKVPAFSSVVVVLLNIFLNVVMVVGFKFGALSIAIATSLSTWCNAFFLVWYLPGILFIISKKIISQWGRVILSSAIAAFFVFLLDFYWIFEFSTLSFLSRCMYLAFESVMFVSLLWMSARLFNAEDLLSFVSFTKTTTPAVVE